MSTKRLDPTALRTSPTVKVFDGTFIPKKSNLKKHENQNLDYRR